MRDVDNGGARACGGGRGHMGISQCFLLNFAVTLQPLEKIKSIKNLCSIQKGYLTLSHGDDRHIQIHGYTSLVQQVHQFHPVPLTAAHARTIQSESCQNISDKSRLTNE